MVNGVKIRGIRDKFSKKRKRRRRLLLAAAAMLLGTGMREYGVHPLNRGRESMGEFRNLYYELRQHEDRFFEYFRLSISQFDVLLEKVRPLITKRSRRKPVSPEERLVVTLRCLAAGLDFTVLSQTFWLGKITVGNIVRETCGAIFRVLKDEYLLMPSTPSQWEQIAERFLEKWDMPLCVGAMDGKHVHMKCPGNGYSVWFNYKGTHSFVLFAVCDADYGIVYYDIGAPGRVGDGFLFNTSEFSGRLLKGKMRLPPAKRLPNSRMEFWHYFVGDEAFPLMPNLMRPYPGRRSQLLEASKQVFNYRLSRARRVIENTFGIIAARWRILHKPLQCLPYTGIRMIQAVLALHNYARLAEMNTVGPRRYIGDRLADFEDRNGETKEGDWRKITKDDTCLQDKVYCPSSRSTVLAHNLRDSLATYFMQEGKIEWQEKYSS